MILLKAGILATRDEHRNGSAVFLFATAATESAAPLTESGGKGAVQHYDTVLWKRGVEMLDRQ